MTACRSCDCDHRTMQIRLVDRTVQQAENLAMQLRKVQDRTVVGRLRLNSLPGLFR